MKLSEMTFEDSRMAEIKISTTVERIMSDKETAALVDKLFNTKGLTLDPNMNKAKQEIAKANYTKHRMEATVGLTKRLIYSHYEELCEIFSVLNDKTKDEIKAWTRSEADKQLADMFQDENLISFFMSSEALVQAAQFATL